MTSHLGAMDSHLRFGAVSADCQPRGRCGDVIRKLACGCVWRTPALCTTAMRAGVVILNFGGPRRAEEVEPFLFELFNDPDVIKLPFGAGMQRRFARMLSGRRAPLVTPHYQHIGFSPLVETTMAQVQALQAALGDGAPPIYLGMRYSAPTIDEMVQTIAGDPPDRLVALALYPHYSDTTTGSSFTAFSNEMKAQGMGDLPVHYIPAFHEHPSYLAAMKTSIEAAGAPDGAHLLFSAHGLPSTYARDGADPYPDHIKMSARLIVQALGWGDDYSLAFQSQVGPVRWLKPSTEEALTRLAADGVKDVIVVPLSFVTEGIETLYEIDILFGDVAKRLGLVLHRAKTLDTDPDFITCLADVVRRGLADESFGGLGTHRCVRCLLPKPHAHRTRVQCLDCGYQTPQFLLQLPPVR